PLEGRTPWPAGGGIGMGVALPFARRSRASFGLDVGTSTVQAVQLRGRAGGYTLTPLGGAPLPASAIADGTIREPAAVAEAIKEAVDTAGIKLREVTIGIAGRELIMKKVQLPEVPAKELRNAVEL